MPHFIRLNQKTSINADHILRVDQVEMGPMQGAGPTFLIVTYTNGTKDEFHGVDIETITAAVATLEFRDKPEGSRWGGKANPA